MFACLCPLPRETDAIAVLRQWRRPPAPQMIRVETPGGAPFFRLECAPRKGVIPWNAVEHAAGRCRTRMLFPEGICPPAPPSPGRAMLEPGLRAFEAKRLPLLLHLQAAMQVLRRCETPAQKLSVTLVDPKGILCRCVEPLVMLAGSLRVFTPDFAVYRAAAAQLLIRYGVTLILSDSVGCFAQSDVIVAQELSLFTGRERGLIFSPDSQTPLPQCRVVRVGLPELPPAYAALCPPGINPLRFAGALFELCGVKEMERLRFNGFWLKGRQAPLCAGELAALVDQAAVPDFSRV